MIWVLAVLALYIEKPEGMILIVRPDLLDVLLLELAQLQIRPGWPFKKKKKKKWTKLSFSSPPSRRTLDPCGPQDVGQPQVQHHRSVDVGLGDGEGDELIHVVEHRHQV